MFRCVCVAAWVLLLISNDLFGAAPPARTGVDRYGDPLPPGAVARLGTLRWRPVGAVTIFSPDGKVLFNGGEDGCRAWEVATGKPLAWGEKLPRIQNAHLLPDGKTLVTMSLASAKDNRFDLQCAIRRWRWGTGEMIGEPVWPAAEVERYGKRLLSGDGKLLFMTGFYEGERWVLCDAHTGRKLHGFNEAWTGAISPDGKQLVITSPRAGLNLFDAITGKHLRQFISDQPGKEYPMGGDLHPTVSPDGTRVVVRARDAISLFDLRTGKRLANRQGKQQYPIFSPDGKWLAVAGLNAFHLLDGQTLKPIRTFPHEFGWRATVLAFSPDGKRLAVSFGEAIRVLDLKTGKMLPAPEGHYDSITALAFSADGRRLATGSQDGTARIWDVTTSRQLHAFADHYWSVAGLAFSPDGKRLATGDGRLQTLSGDGEVHVRLFDLNSGRLLRCFPAHLNGIPSLLFSPDGKQLATAGHDARIRLWDVATGKRIGQVRDLPYRHLFAFADGGKSLLVGKFGEECQLFDVASLEPVMALPGKRTGPRVYLPRRRQIVTMRTSPEFGVVWHDLSGNELSSVRLSNQRFTNEFDVVLSPNATMLAHFDWREGIHLWDLESGWLFATLKVPKGHIVTKMLFSPDEGLLATASNDTTVLLWDLWRPRLEHLLTETLARRGGKGQLPSHARLLEQLTTRLREVATVQERITRLITDLDDDDFRTRNRASKALAKMAAKASGELRQAARTSPSLEVRRRALELLKDVNKEEADLAITPARTRYVIHLLARLNMPGVRQALLELAKFPANTSAGKEARAVLEQMRKEQADH